MSFKRTILAVGLAAAASTALAAEPSPPPSSAQDRLRAVLAADIGPMPSDAAILDGYVARQDWTPLIQRLSPGSTPRDVARDLNWERLKVVSGGSFFFDISYVNSVWTAANSLPPPVADQMRQTALAFALYGVALIDVDGPRCKDPTAPAHKIPLAMKNWAVIFKYGQSLPPKDQDVVKQVALKLEWATAPVRANDPVLCRGGLSEMQANLQAGAKPRETPIAPAPNVLPGKAYEVPSIVDYKPEYLAEAVWKPVAEARRAKLPETFASLLKAPAPPPVTPLK